MKKVFLIIALTALVVGFMGCGQGAPTSREGAPVEAWSIDDDNPNKFRDGQIACPVCDGIPIKGEHYVDTKRGRVYFDKAECAEKFEQDTQKYLQQWQQAIDERMRGDRDMSGPSETETGG